MSAAVTPAPERPARVPPGATWEPARGEWLEGERDAQGRWHGLVTGYSSTGVERSRQYFEAGVAHGSLTRLHPSGNVALSATFVDGKLHGEVRSQSSHEPEPVPLRPCCVPRGAWSLVARYEQGQLRDEWFENEAGQALLGDGSLRPARPASVPDAATFDEATRQWLAGDLLSEARRQGPWRRWTEAGELLEVTNYSAGKPHGRSELYVGGKLQRVRHFVDGVLEGPASTHHQPAGAFADPRIAAWRGDFSRGLPHAVWQYLDVQGQLIDERDYGVPCQHVELTHPVFSADAPPEGWAGLAEALAAKSQIGLALCAWARAALASGEPQALRERLDRSTMPLSEGASAERIRQLRVALQGSAGRGPQDRSPGGHDLAPWIQALIDGVSPPLVLGNLGTLLLRNPAAGLEFVEVALALDPEAVQFVPARAMLLFELGRPEAAFEGLDRLQASDPLSATWVRNNRRILFPRFDFWPDRASFDIAPNPELPDAVVQPLAAVRRCWLKSAHRLGLIRAALEKKAATDLDWLPPDLSASLGTLADLSSIELEHYEFDDAAVEDDGEGNDGGGDDAGGKGGARDGVSAPPERVRVDERLALEGSGLGITALMRLARVEWTALCWLCWGAGLREVALPQELRPPADFARALATAFFRVFRVVDSVQTRGLRSKSRGIGVAHWEDLDVDVVDAPFPKMALQEVCEVRAVLFWLADESCRSLWQDDLREV